MNRGPHALTEAHTDVLRIFAIMVLPPRFVKGFTPSVCECKVLFVASSRQPIRNDAVNSYGSSTQTPLGAVFGSSSSMTLRSLERFVLSFINVFWKIPGGT